jgi:hypothetical protein
MKLNIMNDKNKKSEQQFTPQQQPAELLSAKQPELRDITKLIETINQPGATWTPTWPPENVYAQIKIVVEGANASLYIYDSINNKWRGAALGT